MPSRVAKPNGIDTDVCLEMPVVAVNNQVAAAFTFPTPDEISSLSQEDQIAVDAEVEVVLRKILFQIKANYNGREIYEQVTVSAVLSTKVCSAVLEKVKEILRNSNWKITFSRLRSGCNPNSFSYWVSDYQKALEAEAIKVARDKSRKQFKVTLKWILFFRQLFSNLREMV